MIHGLLFRELDVSLSRQFSHKVLDFYFLFPRTHLSEMTNLYRFSVYSCSAIYQSMRIFTMLLIIYMMMENILEYIHLLAIYTIRHIFGIRMNTD